MVQARSPFSASALPASGLRALFLAAFFPQYFHAAVYEFAHIGEQKKKFPYSFKNSIGSGSADQPGACTRRSGQRLHFTLEEAYQLKNKPCKRSEQAEQRKTDQQSGSLAESSVTCNSRRLCNRGSDRSFPAG